MQVIGRRLSVLAVGGKNKYNKHPLSRLCICVFRKLGLFISIIDYSFEKRTSIVGNAKNAIILKLNLWRKHFMK